MSKYTELNMYFNNQELCYFLLTIIQLEIGIGISRIGPISVPRVTFDIATSQHRDRIRGDILVNPRHLNKNQHHVKYVTVNCEVFVL